MLISKAKVGGLSFKGSAREVCPGLLDIRESLGFLLCGMWKDASWLCHADLWRAVVLSGATWGLTIGKVTQGGQPTLRLCFVGGSGWCSGSPLADGATSVVLTGSGDY